MDSENNFEIVHKLNFVTKLTHETQNLRISSMHPKLCQFKKRPLDTLHNFGDKISLLLTHQKETQ